MYFLELLRRAGGKSTLELVVFGIYIGALIACGLALYEKRVVGGFVRRLLKEQCFTPEQALPLKALKPSKFRFLYPLYRALLCRSLSGKSALSSLVYMPEEETGLGEPKTWREETEGKSPEARPVLRSPREARREDARFYIPLPLRYRAQVRFEQKGTHVMALVMAAIAFAVLGLLIVTFTPTVLDFFRQNFSEFFTLSLRPTL